MVDGRDFAARLGDPLLWLVTGKIAPGKWFGGLLPSGAATRGIGALAIFNGQGWDAYGRYDGREPDADDAPEGLRDVHVGPSPAALQLLADLMRRAQ